MSQLKSLATIIEYSNQIGIGFSFVHGFPVLNPDKSWDYFEAWRGSILNITMGRHILGEKADSFKLACNNLLTKLQMEEDSVNVSTINEIPHFENVEPLITQLQIAKSNYHDNSPSLILSYRPPFGDYEAEWTGVLMTGGRWQDHILARMYGKSLYEVCSKLREEFQNIR
jgi:hypothetical protein